jgi:hypothetical protein
MRHKEDDVTNYNYPDPFSFGSTGAFDRSLRREKQEFKKAELKEELKEERLTKNDESRTV